MSPVSALNYSKTTQGESVLLLLIYPGYDGTKKLPFYIGRYLVVGYTQIHTNTHIYERMRIHKHT